VWKFFAEEYDKDGTATHVKCKSCGTVLHRSKASSTTQMRTHLRTCLRRSKASSTARMQTHLQTCGNGKNIPSKNKQKVDQIKVREILSIMSIFFLRIVEHELFNKFIKLAHCIGKKFLIY
jgi:hypothetical protein